VYREQDWWQKLVVILDAKLDFIRDPIDQITVLHEIAKIHEERGGALDLALEALARAWRIDVAEDESLMKLLPSPASSGGGTTGHTLEEGPPRHRTGPGRRPVARAAEIHEAQRRDRPRAIRAWRKVEESRPDDVVALAALDRLLASRAGSTSSSRWSRDARSCRRTRASVWCAPSGGALYDEVLNDRPAAIAAYRTSSASTTRTLAALDALEGLYRDANDGRELATVLERKIELTADLSHARGCATQRRSSTSDSSTTSTRRSVAHAILDDDAVEPVALAGSIGSTPSRRCARAARRRRRRALLATNAQDRADLAFRAGHLVEVELVDPESAIPRYGAVLQVLPSHPAGVPRSRC